jgi:eukaryotic-like serine/threonine-protein kinase
MSSSLCPRCGSVLRTDSLEGLCPACILAELATPALDLRGDPADLQDARQAELADDWRLEPGDRFGPYRIDRRIGRGGMGEVYEAEHIEQCRRVALKVLHHRLRRPNDRARFLAEGQLAAAVNHPNSVYVFDTGEIAGVPVIAMELVAGGTLKDRVRNGRPLPPAQAVDAILQVIDGLDAAHAAGILHRDVKPSNCFVDQDGTIKVGDFGLSISLGSREAVTLTRRTFFAGTPEFAAPEQILGEPLDVRADIYSVGATLYFLLTGHPPFESATLDELITRIHTEPLRFSPDLQSRIAADLAALIRRCLAKPPSKRPTTYATLRNELRRFASSAAEPAPIGLRAAATAFDLVLLFPIAAIVLGGLVGSQVIREPVGASLVLLTLPVLYWGLLEGVLGAGYGKRRCGLCVVTLHGDLPGVMRALARGALFVLPLASLILMAFLASSLAGHSSPALLQGLVFSLGTGLLVLPSRQRNDFAALHDILTGTRVIKRSRVPEPARPHTAARIAEQATRDRVGPYNVVSVLGTTDGGRVLLGWDPRLERSVWIHVRPTDALQVPSVVRNVSRPTRLHWLQSQRTEESAWDAYESPDGQPLLALARAQPWRSVSIWLGDLARELAAGTGERSVEVLALDRIWITAAGRAKLLDFRAPGLSEGESPTTGIDMVSAQRFLHAAARHALGSPVPPPPLSVSACLRMLERGGFGTLSEISTALAELQARPDRVTSISRGMTLGLGAVVYLLTSDVLGRILINGLFPHVMPHVLGRLSLTVSGAGLIGCAALSLVSALTFRSGVWLRAFGIAVVTPEGREVSRLRAVWRAALVWSWVPAQLLWAGHAVPVVLIVAAKLVGLCYAADHPERGIQDRLAGTYLVPR